MWKGKIEAIYIGPERGEALASVPEARAVAGKGLEGDRKFREGNDPEREITLIEAEALAALKSDYGIDLGPGGSRRNVVTRGVPLNHLVGAEFSAGGVRLRGVELCEPCGYLEKLTGEAVLKGLAHRGGLRAQILMDGTIRAGDAVEPAEA